jgi:hypothetical protein
MIGYVKIREPDESQSDAYHCSECGAFITHAGALLRINGAEHHSFVNPVGIHCNFITFADCNNVVAHEDLFVRHSWFPGYGWRFLTCRVCSQHLGWKYDALAGSKLPARFFGVLSEAVETIQRSQ